MVTFTKRIIKIKDLAEDEAEDLILVSTMYNLVEYSRNYSDSTGSLSIYSKDEATDFNNNTENTDAFKPSKYEANLL